MVEVEGEQDDSRVVQTIPRLEQVAPEIPERARHYLQQAIDTISAASASIMVANSAVDAMLKEQGYKEGTLYARLSAAEAKGLITTSMAAWAHNVRLDANIERHADEDAELPSSNDAQRCVEFARALGEYLYVLPSRVTRGLKDAGVPMPKAKSP